MVFKTLAVLESFMRLRRCLWSTVQLAINNLEVPLSSSALHAL